MSDGNETAAAKTVVGPHREVEVLDRHGVLVRRKLNAGAETALDDGEGGAAHVREETELIDNHVSAAADGLDGAHRAVGPHFEGELVVVRRLTNARVGDLVIDLANRREDGVDGDNADCGAVHLASGRVPTARLDVELDVEPSVGRVYGREIQVLVHDLVVFGYLKVSGGDRPLAAADIENEGAGPVRESAQPQLLDVEQELDCVLSDVRDRRELVEDAVDSHRSHSSTLKGA